MDRNENDAKQVVDSVIMHQSFAAMVPMGP